ncbi:Metallo-hydrolase/oxidoreductase [Athelia psychrophila]|uniref:Metallo-hydrolase/oxidoreductase n=1 Tax=Athelia psychrophila TaxID=1759441 RepID=A0A167WHD1_9AGAM|nr:Metallo-hydrolase/oxidoreductase [Fibularhizoctonia sp. CBS 109695]
MSAWWPSSLTSSGVSSRNTSLDADLIDSPQDTQARETPRPAHHLNDTKSSFANPWPQAAWPAASALLALPFVRAEPVSSDVHPVKTVEPDWTAYEQREDGIRFTWLGHAGFIVQLPPVSGAPPIRVLFDPMFAARASPSAWFGPMRYLPAPCAVEDLPEVDYVCISHNHYDHCQTDLLLALYNRTSRPLTFLVPLGVKALLVSTGIDANRIAELDWWASSEFPIPPAGADEEGGVVTFTCTPTQHNSGRGLHDQGATLWASWAVKQTWREPLSDAGTTDDAPQEKERAANVWHAGDTGYQSDAGPCPVFKEIGEKHGPFDLTLVPIWRGASLSFLSRLGYTLDPAHAAHPLLLALHASPADAMRIHRDVKGRHGVAMHFATFAGGEAEATEPLVRMAEAKARLRAAGEEGGVDEGGVLEGGAVGDWWEEGGFGHVDVGAGGFIKLGD